MPGASSDSTDGIGILADRLSQHLPGNMLSWHCVINSWRRCVGSLDFCSSLEVKTYTHAFSQVTQTSSCPGISKMNFLRGLKGPSQHSGQIIHLFLSSKLPNRIRNSWWSSIYYCIVNGNFCFAVWRKCPSEDHKQFQCIGDIISENLQTVPILWAIPKSNLLATPKYSLSRAEEGLNIYVCSLQ